MKTMGQSEYISWQRYWKHEPWGAWRDNVHAALIAREVRRPQLRPGSKLTLDDFMVVAPAERRKQNKDKAFSMFEMMAGPREEKKVIDGKQ